MDKLFKCERCGRCFKLKCHLSNHLRRKNPCKNINENIKVDKSIIESISKENIIPKPLIKWVGGKSQIIEKILYNLPRNINNYHEIFLGGGSVLLLIIWAKNNGIITIKNNIYAYDLNKGLIGMYNNIKSNHILLYNRLIELKTQFNNCNLDKNNNKKPMTENEALLSKESYYYWIRNKYNNEIDKSTIDSSAYFIFLNRIGFRGMYREGPNGFNIPYGNYKNPQIIKKNEIEYISKLIKNVYFVNCDFSEAFKNINENDNFIYLDPPYAPENTKSFVSYNKCGFNIEQHQKLFELTNKKSTNNYIMMSNSNVDLVKDNMLKYNYDVFKCKRRINSKNPSATTDEVLITNYA